AAPVMLTVAGSDSGGGAGIQADLKACEALGVFGTTALVALTAQNTLGVHAVHPVPAAFVRAQIDAVLGDMGAHAVKTGMLPSEEAIATALDEHAVAIRVIDPVIVAASGDVLAGPAAVAALKRLLLPTATWSSLPSKAGALLGVAAPTSVEEMRAAAAALLDLGPQAVLLKGGRLPAPEAEAAEGGAAEAAEGRAAVGMVDVYADAEHGVVELRYRRVATNNTHGAGCTLAAAVAAELAKQVHSGTGPLQPLEAVRAARAYVAEVFAASAGGKVGTGLRGPLNH
ncbi:hypothetical protein EMIHUDRAFT_55659, partial [Emiliania huxleyi CCMP1516]|uniref:Pyridoxamine kinase/Phosphomethylpyrimidine kinase domain-containing protein n=2 Tax=Emiliania huxleyi TaxID=2903 RepID=A0A0D3K1R1_EMIH1